MRRWRLLALASAMAAIGWSSAAGAAPIITSITASGPGLGSFSSNIDANNRALDLEKTFGSVNPITLTFTVEHTTGPGNPYSVLESITNNSGTAFTDFHFAITEPPNAPGNGVVFTSFNKSTLTGFTLDQPPRSGPRNLNFTGLLADNGGVANAGFNLSPFDPGADKTYTFTITQTPTIPEPGTWGMLAAGLAAAAAVVRRRLNT